MALKLDVRLRVLIPAAENTISGNAFRPGDVLTSRAGHTVEIGNTDAEGRLVLADALTLADEDAPDTMLTFATLTGAARVALGPGSARFLHRRRRVRREIARRRPARSAIRSGGCRSGPATSATLDSEVADMNNVSDGPFAGAIIAALFLRRFVRQGPPFRPFRPLRLAAGAAPLGPKGGEPQRRARVLGAAGARGAGRCQSRQLHRITAAASSDTRISRRPASRTARSAPPCLSPDLAAEHLQRPRRAPRLRRRRARPGRPPGGGRAAPPGQRRPASIPRRCSARSSPSTTTADGWAWVQLERDGYVGYVAADSALRCRCSADPSRLARSARSSTPRRHQVAAAHASVAQRAASR